jgi:hypothetical protein
MDGPSIFWHRRAQQPATSRSREPPHSGPTSISVLRASLPRLLARPDPRGTPLITNASFQLFLPTSNFAEPADDEIFESMPIRSPGRVLEFRTGFASDLASSPLSA